MKRCPDCALEKPRSDFYKAKNRPGGVQSICKQCTTLRSLAYQKLHPDRKRLSDQKYGQRHAAVLKVKRSEYYQQTKRERQKASRASYWKNREARLAYHKRWRGENAEKKREMDLRYARANRKKAVQRASAWKKANPSKVKINTRRYHEKHPEQVRKNKLNRRVREKTGAGRASVQQVEARLAFYGHCCWVCGVPYKEIDHVVPVAKGGTGWPANLRPLCQKHNRAKGAKHPHEFLASLPPRITTVCPLPD